MNFLITEKDANYQFKHNFEKIEIKGILCVSIKNLQFQTAGTLK